MRRPTRHAVTLAAVGIAAAAVTALPAGTASAAAPAFADAASATVTPGVQTYTAGGQCTANFVFRDGTRTYIGQAAHCAGLGEATDTNGCDAGSLPLGTPVEVTGASKPGRLAYSSWLAMQAAGETDPNACAYNDFALIELDPADIARTNPSVPFFGGPTGLATGTTSGQQVQSYGNSSLRLGITQLSPKYGLSLGDSGGGWTTSVYTASPGVPGDSGSGFFTTSGQAFGTLSTLAIAPTPLSNGVSNLSKEVAYAQSHGVAGLTLVKGTEAYNGGGIPVVSGLLG